MIYSSLWDKGDIWANRGCFNPGGSGIRSI